MGNYFLNKITVAQAMKTRIDKGDYIKMKKLLYIKGNNYQSQARDNSQIGRKSLVAI
jgi:hypothetical protein